MELDLRVIDVAANILLLSISGKVRSGEADLLESALERVCKGPPAKLILDVHAVDSVDSSGMGILIKSRNDIVGKGGKVVLIGVTDRVSMIIRISGLENYFQIAATREEALSLMRESAAGE